MTEQFWWYVARSCGIVALVLAGASVIWGLLLSTKLLEGRPGPRWLLDLHGSRSLLATSTIRQMLHAPVTTDFSVAEQKRWQGSIRSGSAKNHGR